MIKDNVFAKIISDLVLRYGKDLNQSVALIKDNCSEEEFKVYRNAVGKVMGELLIEVMNPLYRSHPDLKPDELYVPKNKPQ